MVSPTHAIPYRTKGNDSRTENGYTTSACRVRKIPTQPSRKQSRIHQRQTGGKPDLKTGTPNKSPIPNQTMIKKYGTPTMAATMGVRSRRTQNGRRKMRRSEKITPSPPPRTAPSQKIQIYPRYIISIENKSRIRERDEENGRMPRYSHHIPRWAAGGRYGTTFEPPLRRPAFVLSPSKRSRSSLPRAGDPRDEGPLRPTCLRQWGEDPCS